MKILNFNKISMANLTIRIDEALKTKAMRQAKKLGVPLSLIIKNALKNFVKKPEVIIGEPEIMEVPPDMRKKMNELAELMRKKGI